MENIFEVIVGPQKLRWDAVWRVINWLLNPNEDHGCGSGILQSFSSYIFGMPSTSCWSVCEYKLRYKHNDKEKWPDLCVAIPCRENATRVVMVDDYEHAHHKNREKCERLKHYHSLAKLEFPSAEVKIIFVTKTVNVVDGMGVCALLDEGSPAFEYPGWWKPLPLRIIGEWIEAALQQQTFNGSVKTKLFLEDLVGWSKSL